MLRLIYGFFQTAAEQAETQTQSVLNLQSVPAQYDWLEEEATRVRLESESELFSMPFFDSQGYQAIIIKVSMVLPL